ncbi:MAG: hypothetical protein JSU09_10590 [Bacteroidetes bacterium]|nr:hypothetical protein [Bacteroidota bacterium]
MNYYKKLSFFALATISLFVTSCDENDDIGTPSPATTSSSTKTNFMFINAIPDGSSLDLFVNGIKGATVDVGAAQTGYTPIDIQTGFAANGTTSIANTSIRAIATSGSIGGVLGSGPLLYRQTNTGFGNFTSATGAFYTAISLDSLNRPQPLRTFSISTVTKALAADVTYYNTANGSQISNDQYKGLPNDAARALCVSLGTIPAGTTDVGGPRFLILTDVFPTLTSTQAGIRFINGVANAYATPLNRRVFARLRATAGSTTDITLSAATPADYVMGGGNNAGSRTASTAFTPQTIAASATSLFTYTLEVATDAAFNTIVYSQPNLTFATGKSYTIVARGILGKTDNKKVTAIVATHN